MLPYLIFSIVAFIVLGIIIAIKAFVLEPVGFSRFLGILTGIDVVLLAFALYLYFSKEYGMLVLSIMIQIVYIIISLVTIKRK